MIFFYLLFSPVFGFPVLFFITINIKLKNNTNNLPQSCFLKIITASLQKRLYFLVKSSKRF
jgi:hypothetical protein